MPLMTLLTMITFQVGVNHHWDGSSISRYLEASITLICHLFCVASDGDHNLVNRSTGS
jgi:hypothetical protein